MQNTTIRGLAAAFTLAVGLSACGEVQDTAEIKPPQDTAVSHIVVDKSDRLMVMFNKSGQPIKSYDIALGFNPIGDKVQQGDGRTPEGTYRINIKNPGSSFTRSLGISYPNRTDRLEAYARGVSPGGDIFIHGQPNGTNDNWQSKRGTDWTNGCIAVRNTDIYEIYGSVRNGTQITIKP